jgi:Ca2+-binding EF-hand superfamily protein
MTGAETTRDTANVIERNAMRTTIAVLTMLIACSVIVGTSIAADDAAAKKQPAKTKWIQTMEKTFKTLDKDGDGFLTFDENKGQRKRPEAIERAEQIFKLIDADDDLKVSLKEFTNKPAEARFKLMDRNDDGTITFDEYKGKREKPEEVELAEQRFKRIDKDGDKKLTVEELKAAQKKQQPKKSARKKFQPKLLKAAEKK